MIPKNLLEQRISSILAAWNPLDVPDFLAQTEYQPYVGIILEIGDNAESLTAYLKRLVSETFCLPYDNENPEHRSDIERVSRELIRAYR